MTNRPAILGISFVIALLAPLNQTMAAEVQLHIPQVFQERPNWSWAAVGEMVFKYYYVPAAHHTDYQCGIAQSRKLCTETPNCLDCNLPVIDAAAMIALLEQHPLTATVTGTAGDIALTAQLKTGTLSEAEIKSELDQGRPIIVGLSPTGFKVDDQAQHMALIIGYDDSPGYLKLTVNDPFPFEDDRFMWIGNPYPITRASGGTDGQYELGYEKFGAKLKWTKTIYRITCTGQGCPSENHQIVTSPVGKDDREVMHRVLAASAEDFKTLRIGHKSVDADGGTTWRSLVTFSASRQCLVRDKDNQHGAGWSCLFKFDDRSEADKAATKLVSRLRGSLPDGWAGTDLDEDSDTELYTRTDRFSASRPGDASAIRLYLMDNKKDGRVIIYLSVDTPRHPG